MLLAVNERTFTQEVLETGTPVLVHFWAPWCGLCLMMNPMLSALGQEWGKQIKIVSINADQSLKLASTYRLTTLPTLILFEDGKVRYRLEGFQRRDELYSALKSLIFKENIDPSQSLQKPDFPVLSHRIKA